MNICVYCASSETIDKSYLNAGEKFGETLAENNHTLIFGAGKYGVMGAVARGCRRKGGKVVGVLPNFFNNVDVMFKDCEIIRTETMRERKQIMEDKSDAFVMMPGGIGTFEEFFEILTLKQLRRHNKPIAVYNVNGYYDNLFEMLDKTIIEGFMSEKCRELFFISDDENEILEYFKDYTPFSYDKYEFI
ncbi:MAG: TIGR00730 family Rossman fold protein [Ruminococcus sp.]|nr:TIGR00730 family Rossman fold protein [Ruminococcus sp.]